MYYTLAGMTFTMIASLIASLFFGFNDTSEMDRNLIAPFMHKYMKPSKYDTVEMDEKWAQMSNDKK